MDSLIQLENLLNYRFKDKSILEAAVTHTSYANEHNTTSYERLEFLGDSILGFVTAENLYKLLPEKNEGQLSKIRAGTVCEDALTKLSVKLKLPQYLKLGTGEIKSNGTQKKSIVSDCFEAVVAAIYLDSDFDTVREWVNKVIPKETYTEFKYSDWKTIFQEKHKNKEIAYAVEESDDENGQFTASVYVQNKLMGKGNGSTKKAAEQAAAHKALQKIERKTQKE